VRERLTAVNQSAWLVLVEVWEWGGQGALLPDLQDKFWTYFAYALDGQLAKNCQSSVGNVQAKALH
jgi:hypothetical protein